MSFKVIERGSSGNKLVYKLLLLVCSNFRCISHRFRDVQDIQAVLMLKTTFCLPQGQNLEFEGHAVGMWRRNLVPKN